MYAGGCAAGFVCNHAGVCTASQTIGSACTTTGRITATTQKLVPCAVYWVFEQSSCVRLSNLCFAFAADCTLQAQCNEDKICTAVPLHQNCTTKGILLINAFHNTCNRVGWMQPDFGVSCLQLIVETVSAAIPLELALFQLLQDSSVLDQVTQWCSD